MSSRLVKRTESIDLVDIKVPPPAYEAVVAPPAGASPPTTACASCSDCGSGKAITRQPTGSTMDPRAPARRAPRVQRVQRDQSVEEFKDSLSGWSSCFAAVKITSVFWVALPLVLAVTCLLTARPVHTPCDGSCPLVIAGGECAGDHDKDTRDGSDEDGGDGQERTAGEGGKRRPGSDGRGGTSGGVVNSMLASLSEGWEDAGRQQRRDGMQQRREQRIKED